MNSGFGGCLSRGHVNAFEQALGLCNRISSTHSVGSHEDGDTAETFDKEIVNATLDRGCGVVGCVVGSG